MGKLQEFYGIVYLAVNKTNGKLYVGKTTKTLSNRIRGHIRASRSKKHWFFHDALRKYGLDNFEWQILKYCASAMEMNYWESHYIDFFRSNNPHYGYNLTSGGDGCVASPEVRKRISESLKGHKHSETTKRKLSEKAKEFNRGRRLSESSRNKIRQKLTGLTLPAERKDKIRTKMLGNRNGATPVEQYDKNGNLIRRWNSVTDAAKTLGVHYSTISDVCRGAKHHKTCAGYIWRYAR